MIKVCFPPGCYGTYITRCLYNYTNLRPRNFIPLEFDSNGSSHIHRDDKEANEVIQWSHYNDALLNDTSQLLVILPDQLHYLDYYNNQFVKQHEKELISYIEGQLSPDEIKQKLKSGWNYTEPLNQQIPSWILREFFSFWIMDCLQNGYSLKNYNRVIANAIISTQDIFLNFEETFNKVCRAFNLQINIEPSIITETHQDFLNKQKFHLSQLKCQQWVYDTLLQVVDTPSPCQTIFDESYVQYLLRELGYELSCDGLDIFPKTSSELHKIINK
jgi:hypothetical protein